MLTLLDTIEVTQRREISVGRNFEAKKNKPFLTPVSSLNEFYRETIGALKFDPNTLRILTHKNQIKGFHFFEYDLLQWPTEKFR